MRSSALLLLTCSVALVGCGRSGPVRYSAWGELSVGTEVIAEADIFVEPNTEQGNSGPGTKIRVERGRFHLPKAKGHVGGPHRLRFILYDGIPKPEFLMPRGRVVLYDYWIEMDLPREDATLNLSLLPMEEIKEKLAAAPAKP